MGRIENMTNSDYADLVRRVVKWVQAQHRAGRSVCLRDIGGVFRLNLDEVEDVCGDSTAYGPQLLMHAQAKVRGDTTVDALE